MWGEPLLLQGLRGAPVATRSARERRWSCSRRGRVRRASAALAWSSRRACRKVPSLARLSGRGCIRTPTGPAGRCVRGLREERFRELAIVALDLCLAVRDDSEALRLRADLAIAQGDVSTSHALLQRLVAADPDALEPTLKLVELLAVYMGQGDEAQRLLDVASARHPHEPRIDEVRTIVDGVR